jgi:HAD superfamily hydrolase (TIGR01509 family)
MEIRTEPQRLQTVLKKKNAYFFDMDGTIINLEKAIHKTYHQIVKNQFDANLSFQDYKTYFAGTQTSKGFTQFVGAHPNIPKNLTNADLQQLNELFNSQIYNILQNNFSQHVKLKKGITRFLEQLKSRQTQLFITTSAIYRFTNIILREFGIKHYFDTILTAEDITKSKPHPQIYNTALKKAKVKKDKAIVFEDSYNGIKAAKQSDIFCVGIWTKGLNDEFVEQADIVIKDYTSLLE